MSEMLSIRNLTKRFGPILAVDDVSFTVSRGEVLGFLGPNGAGKSTTMKMIAGYLAPTGGTAVVCGHDVIDDPVEVKRQIGYLPEGAPA
ncbi:MAG: ATP-binding cassette domain-containing protein, partial [Proteobacteria bacterium]|nr:ATP-binding cassette domain-containing protein [Pseudomonadota bacterium]